MVSATRSCGHLICRQSISSLVSQADVPRQEFFDAVDRMVGDACEDVRQIGFRIDSVQFGRADQAVHRGGAFAAGIGSGKQ